MDEDISVGCSTLRRIMAPPEEFPESDPDFRKPSRRSRRTRDRVRALMEARGGRVHLRDVAALLANGKQPSNSAAAVSALLVMAQQGEVRVLDGDYFELIREG